MSKSKKTDAGKAIDILKQKIPLDDKTKMHEINLKYQRLFNYHEPDFKEKKKVCTLNKDSVIKLGNQFLKDLGLNDKITDDLMYKCMYSNLSLFKYVIVTMEKNQHSVSIVQSVIEPAPQSQPIPTPDKDKNSASKVKDAGSKDKDTENKDKDTGSKDKNTGNKDKDTKSKDKDTETKDKGTENKDKGTGNKDKGTENKDKDVESKDKSTESKEKHELFFDDFEEDGIFLYDDSDFGYIYYFTP